MYKYNFVPYQNLPIGTKFYFNKGYYKITGIQHCPEFRNYEVQFLKGKDSMGRNNVLAHQSFVTQEEICYLEAEQIRLFKGE